MSQRKTALVPVEQLQSRVLDFAIRAAQATDTKALEEMFFPMWTDLGAEGGALLQLIDVRGAKTLEFIAAYKADVLAQAYREMDYRPEDLLLDLILLTRATSRWPKPEDNPALPDSATRFRDRAYELGYGDAVLTPLTLHGNQAVLGMVAGPWIDERPEAVAAIETSFLIFARHWERVKSQTASFTDAALEVLTDKQRQALSLAATGCRQREIAAHMNVTPKTVEYHLAQVRKSLGAATTAEAIAMAFRRRPE